MSLFQKYEELRVMSRTYSFATISFEPLHFWRESRNPPSLQLPMRTPKFSLPYFPDCLFSLSAVSPTVKGFLIKANWIACEKKRR